MTGRAAVLALSSTLLMLSTTACGSDRVDKKDLEHKVEDFIQRQTGSTVSVSCPSNVDPDKGSKTTCTADLSGTETNLDLVFTSKGRFQVHVDPSKLG